MAKPLPEKEKRQILRMHDQGWTQLQISLLTGHCSTTISKVIKEAKGDKTKSQSAMDANRALCFSIWRFEPPENQPERLIRKKSHFNTPYNYPRKRGYL